MCALVCRYLDRMVVGLNATNKIDYMWRWWLKRISSNRYCDKKNEPEFDFIQIHSFNSVYVFRQRLNFYFILFVVHFVIYSSIQIDTGPECYDWICYACIIKCIRFTIWKYYFMIWDETKTSRRHKEFKFIIDLFIQCGRL